MHQPVSAETAAAIVAPPPRDWTAPTIWSLTLLTLISTFNYLDRSLLGLALPAIKQEMQVSDTALGLVTGVAFVLFYTLLGIPIAWAADRWNRRNIIAAGLAFWSLMTAVTGLAATIWQLAAARFLMGAGEACGIAPSNSMIADLVRRERRPLALAIFGTASSLAFLIFFPVLGWVADHHGWRWMFAAAGLPGILLAAVFLLTVREPARGRHEAAAHKAAQPPFAVTLRFLLGSRTYLAILAGATLLGANVYAASAWTPTFLSRVHGMTIGEVAGTIGPVRGALGFLGVLAGGLLIDRWGRRDEKWRARLPAIACVGAGLAEILFLLGESRTAWLGGFALSSFLLLIHQGPIFALAMGVAQVRMRAVATAILLFCAGLLGQAIGPLVVGMLADALTPAYGAEAIRYALLVIAATAVLGGLMFWLAARFIEDDIARAA